jgi:double-stranded uracil-DNA glycosylase
VPDVIATGLAILFCGINPGLWSGAVGHHFAHPGNRFWKAIAAAGFTDEVLRPDEEPRLLASGVGITNVVAVTTRTAKELSRDQLRAGAKALEAKVVRYQPRAVVFLGMTAYRDGFERPKAQIGLQPERIGGTLLFVLPNPSGLQAHYPFSRLVSELRAVRDATASD